MPLRTRLIAVTERGVDKAFLLTELPARQSEMWARRAVQMLSNDGAANAGMRELARLVPLDTSSITDLMDELLSTCTRFVPSLSRPYETVVLIDKLDGDDNHISDVRTRDLLRWNLIDLHCGVLLSRRPLELDSSGLDDDGDYDELADYPNVPISIAVVVASRLATMHELETIYGIEDLEDFLEILRVDAHNRRILSRPRDRE